jgi:hypothetical protein
MRRSIAWIIAAPLVLAIGVSISLVARHAGAGGGDGHSGAVATTRCPATSPDACLRAMGRMYNLSAAPLPRVSVPRAFTYRGGEILNNERESRPTETLSFRSRDGQAYEITFGPLDATHRFPPVDPRPTKTTPGGRGYKENRGSQGVIAISFVDSRFIYVVHRRFLALLDPASGSLGNAEALLDAVHAVD